MNNIENQPLWKSVSESIQSDIENGNLHVGEKLCGEFDLCRKYNVSRITVRSALSRLEDMGFIKRIKGKGTIVVGKKINEPLLKIQGFSSEMKEKGIIPGTAFAHMERKEASGYISELFNMPKSAKINVLERVRTINGIVVGYFETFLNWKYALPCDDSLYYSSLYEKLYNEYGITIDRIKQKISAEEADAMTKKALNLDSSHPVLVMKRWAYCKNELIEYSICRYDGEKYEYEMEL